jgi:hypothetical protein
MGVKIFGFIVTLMVAAVTIAGLIIVGSPVKERERRFDEQRIIDLRQIAAAVDLYYSKMGYLPASLNELVKANVARLYYIRSIKDPETSTPYTYNPIGNSRYQLCATFSYTNIETSAARRSLYIENRGWEHPAGYHCFDLLSPPTKAKK